MVRDVESWDTTGGAAATYGGMMASPQIVVFISSSSQRFAVALGVELQGTAHAGSPEIQRQGLTAPLRAASERQRWGCTEEAMPPYSARFDVDRPACLRRCSGARPGRLRYGVRWRQGPPKGMWKDSVTREGWQAQGGCGRDARAQRQLHARRAKAEANHAAG